MVQVNGFGLTSITEIATRVARTSYFCQHDGPGIFYGYFVGIVAVSHYIMAVSCICNILGAIFLRKINN